MKITKEGERTIRVSFTGKEFADKCRGRLENGNLLGDTCVSSRDAYEFAVDAVKPLLGQGEIFANGGLYKRGEQLTFDDNYHPSNVYECVLHREKLHFLNPGKGPLRKPKGDRISSLDDIPPVRCPGSVLEANGLRKVFDLSYCGCHYNEVIKAVNGLIWFLRGRGAGYFFHLEEPGRFGCRQFGLWIDDRGPGKSLGELQKALRNDSQDRVNKYLPRSGFVKKKLAQTAWKDRQCINDLLELEDYAISGMNWPPVGTGTDMAIDRALGTYDKEFREILMELKPGLYKGFYKRYAKQMERNAERLERKEKALDRWKVEEKKEWLKAGGKP